jgi:N-acetyl sugar amidotransferase
MTPGQGNQVCSFCVMDSTTIGISFDSEGRCSCCRDALSRRSHEWWPGPEGGRRMAAMAEGLRAAGRGRPYDAMIGLSGGIDSAYLAHLAVRELGLRVLAVHVDGGWNSEPAVRNIESLVKSLDIDLHTYVVEWQEIRDLQLAFLRASVLNQDIPQDHVFFTTLYRTARKNGIDVFLSGVNYATESIVAPGFGFPYSDDVHLRAIHRKFGRLPLSTYPVMPFAEFLWLTRVRKSLTVHRPLNYIDYNKDAALDVLRRRYAWRDYGTKHSESRFTKFYQDIYLPRRYGFDKRRLHLSSLIVSGQISRQTALTELASPALEPDQVRRDIRFVAKKLGLSPAELDALISAPPIEHGAYPNQMKIIRALGRMQRLVRRFSLRAALGRAR